MTQKRGFLFSGGDKTWILAYDFPDVKNPKYPKCWLKFANTQVSFYSWQDVKTFSDFAKAVRKAVKAKKDFWARGFFTTTDRFSWYVRFRKKQNDLTVWINNVDFVYYGTENYPYLIDFVDTVEKEFKSRTEEK